MANSDGRTVRYTDRSDPINEVPSARRFGTATIRKLRMFVDMKTNTTSSENTSTLSSGAACATSQS